MNFAKLFGRENSLPTMLVPYIADTSDSLKQELVATLCKQCAAQLATLFVWRKAYPSKSRVMSWSPSEKKFLGVDLQEFIMQRFAVKTKDGREWLPDKRIVSLIYEACIAADSPLPEANFTIEAERRRAV